MPDARLAAGRLFLAMGRQTWRWSAEHPVMGQQTPVTDQQTLVMSRQTC